VYTHWKIIQPFTTTNKADYCVGHAPSFYGLLVQISNYRYVMTNFSTLRI